MENILEENLISYLQRKKVGKKILTIVPQGVVRRIIENDPTLKSLPKEERSAESQKLQHTITIKDLVETGPEDILIYRWFGVKSMKRIQELLRSENLESKYPIFHLI